MNQIQTNHHVRRNPEAIAIVGLACRYPGEFENIQKLWEGLQERRNAISETPPERWSADRYYSTNEASRGKAYVRRGGYLKNDPRRFDAAFFGIAPRDAENMDPQQRLLLEVTWEAFENAGLRLPEYSQGKVGVYMGGFMLDHMITQMSFANRSAINQYSAAGMMMTMLSNRISHTFDFRGPSLSIDTACSSSLVAFHYACQDIWNSACEMAVVGGVNVMMRPEYPIGMCKGQFLARDGRCKSFDQDGDGYGRAEGAGVVLLKPLSKAIADGDDIWATVLATGTNQDGRTPGISMPSGEAQAALIREVCDKHLVDPRTVQYVECHGTGTAIGDPTEARAIGMTYGAGRSEEDRVIIGTIKSNLGHMEAGAGVAGVIKAALTLRYLETSPLASLQTPNPNIDFARLGLRLSDDRYPLRSDVGNPARVAVNSFGYGGSNAHAILEHFPVVENKSIANLVDVIRESSTSEDPLLLPISARSQGALVSLGKDYLEQLESGVDPRDLVFTINRRRAHLNHRIAVGGRTSEDLQSQLRAWLNEEITPNVVAGQAPFSGNGKPVFVFTGMGPQWWAMGQDLYVHNPVYRETVDQADFVFHQIAGFSILREMLADEENSRITWTEFAQPANFVLQVGLTAVLKSRGIEPAACVGHSVGELASAYVAGALSLEDALRVSFYRSQQQAKAKGAGSMIAVGVTLDRAKELVNASNGTVAIAAINGNKNITLAGDTDDIADIAQCLTSEGVFNRILDVEVPYHGPAMDPLMAPLAYDLKDVTPSEPRLPLYSTVTGERVTGIEYGAEYWPKNIRQPVEFVRAIESAIQDGHSIFIEVGPHPVLAASLKECIQSSGKDCRQLYTLRRNTSEMHAIDRCVLEHYSSGGDLDWQRIAPQGDLVSLPNYPWQREMMWVENERAAQDRINPIVHPILGTQEAPATPAYRNDFDYLDMHYLRDHQVMGLPILPAAGYIESFMELAAIEFPESKGWFVRDFNIAAPLVMKDDRGIDFVTTLDPNSNRVIARSLENGRMGPGQLHASATIGEISQPAVSARNLEAICRSVTDDIKIDAFYQQLSSIGLQYGPAFQTVTELKVTADRRQCLAKVRIDTDRATQLEKYRIHPSMLDGCFQTLMSMIDVRSAVYLPTGIDEVRLYVDRLPTEIWCHGQLIEMNAKYVDCHIDLYDNEGQPVATVRRLRANAASKRQRVDKFGTPVKLQILKYLWSVGNNLPEPKRLGQWMVVGDTAGWSELVCQQLENFGAIVSAHVKPSDRFSVSGRDYEIQSESAEHWARVFEDTDEFDGIVFTCPLDCTPQSDDPTGQTRLRHIVAGLQAFQNIEREDTPRIYVVTQAGHQVTPSDAELNPSQSTFNGFCRVAFNELEVGRVTSIDLPKQVGDECFDAFIQELICDAPEDEIAIRDGRRFTSELSLVDDLTKDITQVGRIREDAPVLIRPSLHESDIGVVRVLDANLAPLQADEVRVMIEKSAVPLEFIKDDVDEIVERPWMEFVGRVLNVGENVTQYVVGSRVAGFVPAETASHLTLKADCIHAVTIPQDTNASTLVACLKDTARAAAVMQQVPFRPGDVALIEATPFGLELAEQMEAAGIRVQIVTDRIDELDPSLFGDREIDVMSSQRIDQLVTETTADRGFTVIAVQAARCQSTIGWSSLAEGGWIIDIEDASHSYPVPDHAGGIIRSAISLIARRPESLQSALTQSVERLSSGRHRESKFFEVSLADIAWQKLPFSDSLGTLILALDTPEEDLPIIQCDPDTITADGTYLITGGLGGFGQQTANWLIEQGVRSLVLTGRAGADTVEKQAFVAKLRSDGIDVVAVACDASDREAVRELLARIDKELPPLKGIIHSAAAIIDEPIADIDLDHLSTVMRNKADAAWVLHEETLHLPLAHFILYSSAANLVGNSRQSIYSAANGFLNGLAHMRRQMGLPGLSMNWGAIGDVGIVARDEKLEQFLSYVGLAGMESREALDYLRLAINRDVTQIGILLMKSWSEWGRFEVRAGTSPRYQKLIAGDATGVDSQARSALVDELALLESDEQLQVLIALITDVLASILKTDPSQIQPTRPINELGVDSLVATEIQMTLEQSLGLKVAVLELLGDSNIVSLAQTSLMMLLSENAMQPA
ncbi:type I polyketide synthase [Neorhodopirellula pilleata]|uniref:Mycocerosic acid synthase n=1 Tax=Neorhodopirellula pilleata TaxID=2714738 RepID=A0A5C6A1J4_9BACT|nr:type I polyketide synthase [Neorhodopirellula pilleata]TWT93121.1 Mycocerosic acid synthase [Neorhodopirellula pilleata]